MSATSEGGSPRPRRGLPRPGETADGTAPSAASPATESSVHRDPTEPAAAGPAPTVTPRRTGLPRPDADRPRAAASSRDDAPATPPAPAPPPPETARATLAPARLRTVAFAVGLVVVAALVVVVARRVSALPAVDRFLVSYDGTAALPSGAPVGLPVWLEWQHFLNAFFLVLIIRTGWQVRTQRRPPATWVRHNAGPLKTRNPPKKISLTLWTHLTLDVLWLLNGVVFIVLLFVTGQWVRVVPTSWEIVPNAAAAALRYASFDWPTEDGWVDYNALQTLAYCSTIFLAAPLAALTGARMSAAWPRDAKRLNRAFPIEWARAVHYPVMLFFVLFVIVHVALVLATGALRNLNHMYGGSDTTTWVGAAVFAGTVALMAAAVWAARPLVVAPIASLMGRVGS